MIGSKPKKPSKPVGVGQTGGYALPVPKPVDANLTSRYSPIGQRGNTTIAERTGQVLDFVLYGPGYVYVIAVNGDYWHAVGRKAEVTRMNENITRWIMPSARVISLFNAIS